MLSSEYDCKTSASEENSARTSSTSCWPTMRRNCRCKSRWSYVYATVLATLFATVVESIDEVIKNSDSELLKNCTESSHEYVTAQVLEGWPFQIDCKERVRIQSDYYFLETDDSRTNHHCMITSEGSIVYATNVSFPGEEMYYLYDEQPDPAQPDPAQPDLYVVPAVSLEQNGTVFTSILTGGGKCSKTSYTLLVQEAGPQETCDEANYENVMTREVSQGEMHVIFCLAKKNAFYLNAESYEVIWYKDCQEIRSSIKTGRKVSGDFVEVDELKLTGMNFNSTPGEYTCSVTYNGHERHLSKADVCVKYATLSGPPSIGRITQERTKAHSGKDVTLTCGGITSAILQLSFAVMWSRNLTNGNEERICTMNWVPMLGMQKTDSKYDCDLLSNAKEVSTCYRSFEDASQDKNTGVVRMNSSLTIRDFQSSDAGEYICRVISTRSPEKVVFHVVLQTTSLLIIILPTVAGILILLIICLTVVFCVHKGYLKKHWKKRLEKSSSESKSTREKELPSASV